MSPLRRSLLIVALFLAPAAASAQTQTAGNQSPWKQLTIEELLDIDVTTAGRRPDSIRHAAAAVQVLTREELHRAGVRYLAEALRLADAFYVGRYDGRTWIVNPRGLNINGANKLQVMIDGRTIYSPLYSGIFWDAQDLIVEDIERIEIIRGPGASLWGANAVHGVVNVVTRRAADTEGLLATVGSGNEEQAIADVRYGGRAGPGAYRLYAKYGYRDAQVLMDDTSAHDPLRRAQMGGRYDWKPGPSTEATVQGDAYVGRLGLLNFTTTPIGGGNILGRWNRRTARGATQITTFFDRVERHVPDQFGEVRHTFDADLQQTFAIEDRHSLVWGGGYRASSDRTDHTSVLFFEPENRTTHLFNFFVQDEIRLGPHGWFATAGTRLEHNSYSGWELQPTGRIRLTRQRTTVWGAVSRAVRMPTRFDSDLRFTSGFPFLVATGDSAFEPEQLVAYETGVRAQPYETFSFDVTYYHDAYRRLRSQEFTPGAPIRLGNSIQGDIDGIEFGATWEPSDFLRLHGSTTYVNKSLKKAPGSRDISGGEGNDPCCLARAQLFTDLRDDLRLTVLGRFVGALPAPHVPAYGEADVTLQWDLRRDVELSFVGQNLLHDRHPEFASAGQTVFEAFERSFFVTLTLRR
jgi:iron complex outermembrane recepter protein